MDFTELFNLTSLAAKSGVDYARLRSNLLARPEKVRLTPDERESVINALEDGLSALKTFLR